MTDSRELNALREQIVQAGQILVAHDVLDGFGHVSARHPHSPDRFLMTRRIAPALAAVCDVLEFDMQANPVSEPDARTFLERYIHSAVYSARPEVGAVVHGHSPTMVAMSTVGSGSLRAICHTCGFLKDGVPVFEIRDHAGDASNLLISTPDLGDALARTLAEENVVLMRGHGSTVVGKTVPHAVYRAVYSEVNARVQVTASQFGDPVYLTIGEALAAEETADAQVERTWGQWLRQVDEQA